MEKVAVFLWKGVFEVERWKGEMVERFPRNKNHQAIYCVITACEPGSIEKGWQSLFATETGGLSQTGNSVASAGQTSAAP